MSLEKNIMQEMKLAMKNKEQGKLRALRAIKSAILLAKTEKAGTESLSEEQESKLLQKLAKQRKDSISIFKEQNRNDLVEKEEEELEVISAFLPEMMSEDEIVNQVKVIIESTGAQGMQDMGKVMGQASKFFAGKADMSIVSKIVRETLA